MKRIFDFLAAFFGLLVLSPILLIALFMIWRYDRHSPFYLGPRVGKSGKPFHMIKMRSMKIDADKSGVDSTSADDDRITPAGHIIRRFKIDELTQLWNVLVGEMSLVGPRPNVQWAIDGYTPAEKKLLAVRPGITDLSSIVFSDEGDILEGSEDPDLKYDQVIRPWKSRLGILYVENSSVLLDIKIILATILAIINKDKALDYVNKLLVALDADKEVIDIALRKKELQPHPPPGSDKIVQSR